MKKVSNDLNKKILVAVLSTILLAVVALIPQNYAHADPVVKGAPHVQLALDVNHDYPDNAAGYISEANKIIKNVDDFLATVKKNVEQSQREYEALSKNIFGGCGTIDAACKGAEQKLKNVQKAFAQAAQSVSLVSGDPNGRYRGYANDAIYYAKQNNLAAAHTALYNARQNAWNAEVVINGVINIANYKVPLDYEETCTLNLMNFSINACIKDGVAFILGLVITIESILLSIAGVLLDKVVDMTVLNMSTQISGINAINVVWKLLVDFANLCFIFALLSVAIQTILQVKSVEATRTLVRIVIAAILINFSLFIAKAVVDFSNIFTLAIYNQISPGDTLSSAFMNTLGISGVFGASGNMITNWTSSWSSLIAFFFGEAFLIFSVTFNFLAIAWLFIFRYIMIIVVFMFAPIGFMGEIIPALKKWTSKWWERQIKCTRRQSRRSRVVW